MSSGEAWITRNASGSPWIIRYLESEALMIFHDIVKAPQGEEIPRLQNRAASEEVSSWHAVAARA